MAGGLHLHRHAHGRAVERVVERDPHARFEIDATLRPRPLWPAAPAPEEAAEPAEQIREVTEIDVLDPNVPEAAERPRAGLTERVVLLALLRVREQVVRRLDVLEALLGGGVSGVAVGMELSRQLAVRLLDLVLGRRGGSPSARLPAPSPAPHRRPAARAAPRGRAGRTVRRSRSRRGLPARARTEARAGRGVPPRPRWRRRGPRRRSTRARGRP